MPRPKTEDQLEDWLVDKLRIASVPPLIWQELRDHSFVRGALESSGAEPLKALLDEARTYLRLASLPAMPTALMRKPQRQKRKEKAGLLAEAEIRRAGVFSLFLADAAARDRTVLKFRKEVLGQRILTGSEAQSLLSSPAPYLLPGLELRKWGIPGNDYRAKLKHRRQYPAKTKIKWRERVVLELRAGMRRKTYRFSVARSFGDARWLEIPQQLWGRVTPFHLTDDVVEPFVRRSSAFDQLRNASRWLSERFPWQPWDAVWFVLTDTPPFVPPIQPGIKRRGSQSETGDAYRRDLITLEIEPWLSAASVHRVYRAHQKELLGTRNRGLGLKSLDLFRFVMERRGIQGRSPTWEALMVEWNRGRRDRKHADSRNFRRDFERARQAVLLPKERSIPVIRLW